MIGPVEFGEQYLRTDSLDVMRHISEEVPSIRREDEQSTARGKTRAKTKRSAAKSSVPLICMEQYAPEGTRIENESGNNHIKF